MSLSSISIRKAFKNVASENYDKTNIFYYFLLFFVVGLISLFTPDKPNTENLPLYGVLMLCSFIFSIIINGICTIASNNAIHRKRGVFPNPFQEIGKIVITSLSCILGNIFWSVVMLLITALVMVPIMFVDKIAAIIVSAIPLLCLATLFIGAYFNFLISLSLADWFDFKKAWGFMKEAKSFFLSYFVKSLALGLIVGFLFIALMIFALPIANSLKGASSIAASSVIMFFYSIVCVASAVYMVDLTSQFVRKAKKMNKEIVK